MKAQGAYSIEDFRNGAQRRLPRAIFDFFDGGAEDEVAMRANRDAFERRKIVPRVLNDVREVDTSTTLLGRAAPLPLAVAPTGGVGFGWPGGDIAIARAAAALGIPYSLSTTATASIEQVAREAPGRLWFQAYVLRDQAFFDKLIARAFAADYEALMITVDLPVGGKRERDFHNDFSIPFRFTPRNVRDFALHPRWLLRLARHGMPRMENLDGLAQHLKSASAIASSVGRNYDPGFDWGRLARVREQWPRKLVVKGVAHPEDARRLASMGCDAIVVSNHGGRQLDSSCATLDLLPAVASTLAGRVELMVDGGVRRGSDLVKARALGATAVLCGRAPLYGALVAGEAGAGRALDILRDELVRTMQLAGIARFDGIDSQCLAALGDVGQVGHVGHVGHVGMFR